MFSGVSGGGDVPFPEVEVTAADETCSASAVDDTLAIEEATSSPELEAIVSDVIVNDGWETRASLIVVSGRVTGVLGHVTGHNVKYFISTRFTPQRSIHDETRVAFSSLRASLRASIRSAELTGQLP